MGIYYRIAFRHYIMASYYKIILKIYPVKRNPGTPRTCPDPAGALGTPLAPGDAHTRDPRDPHGRQKQPYLNKFIAPEALDCLQILSSNASPQGLPWTILSPILKERSSFWSAPGPNRGRPTVSRGGGRLGGRSLPMRPQVKAPVYILNICIYIYIY